MNRRDFLGVFSGTAVAWPLAANAQKLTMPAIGYLESGSAVIGPAFHAGLKETGFVEGQNVKIEYRVAEAQYDRLPALAADLVDRQVAVIVASGAVVSPLAAQAATKTIPIVFMIGADPVQTGLVASINRPGGNITGVTGFGAELARKRFELLHELLPNAKTIAILINPKNPSLVVDKPRWQKLGAAKGVSIEVASVTTESDFEPAIAGLAEKQVDALFAVPDVLFMAHQESLIAARLNRYSTIRGGMLKASAISSSSFGSPARIDASLLLRTLESHSGSTTTARPTATRSAPILIAPSASVHVLIPPLAMTALRAAMTRANSVIGLSVGV